MAREEQCDYLIENREKERKGGREVDRATTERERGRETEGGVRTCPHWL